LSLILLKDLKKTQIVMRIQIFIIFLFFSICTLNSQAQKKKWSQEDVKKANKAIVEIKVKNKKISSFFSNAYGYAVFPSVGKGGIGIGGAYGKGTVFKKGGSAIGGVRLTQVTIGFQFGGQAYIEAIFFQSKSAFDNFVEGNFEFAPNVTAVALTEGAAINVPYKNGVAVFTMAKGGLMYEATVGGQKFNFIKP
jgi:lipid-binding SYLF domain-containing protein